MRAVSNKTRIETIPHLPSPTAHFPSMRAVSNKTRIETAPPESDQILLPSMRAVSNKTRIETCHFLLLKDWASSRYESSFQ